MTQIHGQIESLKRIRETLDQKEFTRFNSTGDIQRFLKNYDNEKEELFFKVEREFDIELDALQEEGFQLQKNYDALKINAEKKLADKIVKLKSKCTSLSGPAKNAVLELLNWYRLQILLAYKFILEKNQKTIIGLQTNPSKKRLDSTIEIINGYTTNRQRMISERCAPKFNELEYMKSVCTELMPVIAGAIGENLVAKELERLSDDFVLINDFFLRFERPIYNKKENDRIHSIQIDHLLVTHAGIFIIETKNWSKASIANYDLRSPVKQIERANYALYILLHRDNQQVNSLLKRHPWGHKKIPLRNIVAMINHKPKEKFQYVAIKKLRELNSYINHFEPLFNESEVHQIADYLMKIKD
ncbi:nuclease-related domain-containing protein [Flagellimonas sp.]|uniref:nuclease-related domain-containing protein n=1 Tax=Flagellimonas sp. TaxID=2058762 RepID=UPI003BAE2988